MDLIFPHHENEIAQSVAGMDCDCEAGEKVAERFCRHWFHVAHLRVENEKMSKSLGNLFTLEDLGKMGYVPMNFRYLILTGLYNQPFNFTMNGLDSAKHALQKASVFIAKVNNKFGLSEDFFLNLTDYEKIVGKKSQAEFAELDFLQDSWQALCDDLNTPKAIGLVFKLINSLDIEKLDSKSAERLLTEFAIIFLALGIDFAELLKLEQEKSGNINKQNNTLEIPIEISALAEERWQAKLARDWQKADEIRNSLSKSGWKVIDDKESYALERLKI